MTLDPHDPRLTAYAIGELDAREAALVEAELGQSPDAARAVVEIRHAAELLTQALKTETTAAPAELNAASRAAIYAAAESTNGAHAAAGAAHSAPTQATAASHSAPQLRPVSPSNRRAGWLRRHKLALGLVAVAVCAVGLILPATQRAREAARHTDLALYDSSSHSRTNSPSPVAPLAESSREGMPFEEQIESIERNTPYAIKDSVAPAERGKVLQDARSAADGSKKSKELNVEVKELRLQESKNGSKPSEVFDTAMPRPSAMPASSAPQSQSGVSLDGRYSNKSSRTVGEDGDNGQRGDVNGQANKPNDRTRVEKDEKQGVASDKIFMRNNTDYQGGQQSKSDKGQGEKSNSVSEGLSRDGIFSADLDTKFEESDKGKKPGEQGRGMGLAPPLGQVVVDEREARRPVLNKIERLDTLNKRQQGSDSQNSDPDQPQGNAPNTEDYARIVENQFQAVGDQPLSTFSIDVDTASYSIVRRFLNQGTLPPPSAVRIEELINYFHYSYPAPKEDAADPFAAHADVVACPWAPAHRLVRLGIKGREIAADKRPACNLVFLIDVSGSMNQANKLPLVKEGLRMLVEKLGENDSVAIVVYAGASGLALPSTNGTQKSTIIAAIDKLQPGGSTNGASGIQLAYETAIVGFIKGGANRVILATDGDFNVGVTDQGQLVDLIEQKAKSGVFLSVLGFGMGNLKDSTLEKLSDKGNGNYAYIDSQAEARKVLVEQLSGTLVTIAKDVKIQIEFNPAKVLAYRLIGYENRMLAKEDFNDDKKDAGEIGAGHTVTALYEVVPVGAQVASATAEVDPLEYQDPPAPEPKPTPGAEAPVAGAKSKSQDLLMLKLRYKAPDGDTSKLLKYPVVDNTQSIGAAGDDCELAAAVAAFGMQLRHSVYKGTVNYAMILELAESGVGEDKEGYRREFVELVKKAQALGR